MLSSFFFHLPPICRPLRFGSDVEPLLAAEFRFDYANYLREKQRYVARNRRLLGVMVCVRLA